MPKLKIFLVTLLLLQSILAPVFAHGQNVDETAHEIYLDLLSPFCPGRSLNDCPTEKASQLKDAIKAEVAAGRTEDEIIDQIVAQYGTDVKAIPDFKGTNMLAWILPIVFVGIGILVLRKTLGKKESQ